MDCIMPNLLTQDEIDDMLNEGQVGGTHYQKSIQPWAAMESWMSREQFIGFLRGNVIKYMARCDDKGGIEDLRKAAHYLKKMIEVMER
ncbi:hypothetical protein CCP4SC76_7640002 [Gammaproteobacteria bacterium]